MSRSERRASCTTFQQAQAAGTTTKVANSTVTVAGRWKKRDTDQMPTASTARITRSTNRATPAADITAAGVMPGTPNRRPAIQTGRLCFAGAGATDREEAGARVDIAGDDRGA